MSDEWGQIKKCPYDFIYTSWFISNKLVCGLNYRCEGDLTLRSYSTLIDSCVMIWLYHAAVEASCLLGDHLLPLHDQRDWGGFGGKVQVSHHTPFHWLHLRKREYITVTLRHWFIYFLFRLYIEAGRPTVAVIIRITSDFTKPQKTMHNCLHRLSSSSLVNWLFFAWHNELF